MSHAVQPDPAQPAAQPAASESTSDVRIQSPPVSDPLFVLRSKPVLASLTTLALGCALQWIPGLEPYRLFSASTPTAELEVNDGLLVAEDQREGDAVLEAATEARLDLVQPENAVAPRAPRGPIAQTEVAELPHIDALKPPVPIVDASRSLDAFYASLARSKQKEPGAITRIVYHGDSLVASDYVTATVRRALHKEFGDAGHGFALLANAWPSYFHNDIFRFATKGFRVRRVVGPYSKDGLYGLGGVSFEMTRGVQAQFGTAKKGQFGKAVSRVELAYLAQPNGGSFEFYIDEELKETIDTTAESPGSAFYTAEVPDGEHQFKVVAKSGRSRLFGYVLERDTPGVVLDAIGIQGARIRFLDKQDDAHWAEQLKWRKPQLIVYHFGANESGDGFAYSMEDYHRTMKDVLVQAKKAVPEAGCLVLAAMDRARKKESTMITVPIIPHIVKEQEKTAQEVGCAFWNTYHAMGGYGSMAIWVRRGLGQADLTHPTGAGAQKLGNWLYQALIEGYEGWRKRQNSAGNDKQSEDAVDSVREKDATQEDTQPSSEGASGSPAQ